MAKWKPNKTTKPVLWFDVKSGTWFVDLAVLRAMFGKGLGQAGKKVGVDTLKRGFVVAQEEMRLKAFAKGNKQLRAERLKLVEMK